MLIEIAKIQFIGTQEVKSFNKPCVTCVNQLRQQYRVLLESITSLDCYS